MFKNIKLHLGELTWKNRERKNVAARNVGAYACGRDTVLAADPYFRKITAFDENGKEKGSISASKDLYFIRLGIHPEYGASVIAAVLDEDRIWQQQWISVRNGEFQIREAA